MKDRFSGQAREYAAFRPRYPEELYHFIFQNIIKFDLAWDAGTGNGQAAMVLASRFRRVSATDISAKQLENAVKMGNVEYAEAGETTVLPNHAVDLITVAQAIHWFDRKKFYAEVQRVATPKAILAIWGYSLLHISESVDPLISDFYTSTVGPYWDAERKLVDEHYRTIEFPFTEIPTPTFFMTFEWSLQELEGYLTTWSAVQKYAKDRGTNPVPDLIQRIEPVWGDGKRRVEFPLFVRIGKI